VNKFTNEVIIMKTGKQKSNWLVDAGLLTGFLVAFFLDLTGVAVHQWLGISIGFFCGYHLLVHWTWVKAVTQRYFGRTSGQASLFYLVDASLLLGLVLIIGSGLVISTWLNLTIASYANWKNLHIWVSLITLALLVVKIGLHWRWIVVTARRTILSPFTSPAMNSRPLQAAATPANTGRRDFLKLMGVVGAAAVLAAGNALNDTGSSSENVSFLPQESLTSGTSSDSTSSELFSPSSLNDYSSQLDSSTTCSQRCNKGCSYPGHCHRYTDSNGNNLCDLGECI